MGLFCRCRSGPVIQTVWDWEMTRFYSQRWGGSANQWTQQGQRSFRVVIGTLR